MHLPVHRACVYMVQGERKLDLSARVSSGCIKKHGSALLLFFFPPLTLLERSSFSQTSNSPAFDCLTTKEEREAEGN